jgi:hypothetical protein
MNMLFFRSTSLAIIGTLLLAVACQTEKPTTATSNTTPVPAATVTPLASPSPSPQEPAKFVPIEFADVTESAGIRFRHNNGASGKKYMPETTGSGCAFIHQ